MPRAKNGVAKPVNSVTDEERDGTDDTEINSPSGALVLSRDEGGLTLVQRRFLAISAVEPDVRKAAARAGVTYRTVRGWIQTEPAFKRAIDRLFDQAIDAGKTLLNSLVPQAAEMYEEALNANRPIRHPVICPECQHEFEAEISASNWGTRMKAGEVVLKRIGDLKDYSIREHTGAVRHVSMTVEQQIALLAFQTGRPITPGMRRELEQLGLIEPDSQSDRSEGSDQTDQTDQIIPGEIDRPTD